MHWRVGAAALTNLPPTPQHDCFPEDTRHRRMTRHDYMNTYPSLVNLMTFGGAMVLSWGVTWALVRWKRTWGVDLPDDRRKHHERPVSRVGGLPIFIALVCGFLVTE